MTKFSMMNFLQRSLAQPSSRFLICGGIAAFVNWLVRFPLSLVMPFVAAVFAALVIGMCVGFVLYKTFVWPPSGQSLHVQIGKFILVNSVSGLGVLAVATLLAALLTYLGVPAQIAEAGAHGLGIAIGAVINFLGHSRFTFAKSDKSLTPCV